MPYTDTRYIDISRAFRNLSDEEIAQIGNSSKFARAGWIGTAGWDDVLRSPRVLIISEAGAGKTCECRAQKERLIAAGKPAFFLELATLANTPVRDILLPEEEDQFDAWLRSQSDNATFFLDSVDELKLTRDSFRTALTRIEKELRGQLSRAQIVVTTRPVPFDRAIIEEILPLPPPVNVLPTAEGFADMMMERGS